MLCKEIILYFNILGVCKCHSNLVNDAVVKLPSLTYGRNHPISQRFLYIGMLIPFKCHRSHKKCWKTLHLLCKR